MDIAVSDSMSPPTRLCVRRRLFVCLLAGLRKLTRPIFSKFGGTVAHGPRKKPLDIAGNPYT